MPALAGPGVEVTHLGRHGPLSPAPLLHPGLQPPSPSVNPPGPVVQPGPASVLRRISGLCLPVRAYVWAVSSWALGSGVFWLSSGPGHQLVLPRPLASHRGPPSGGLVSGRGFLGNCFKRHLDVLSRERLETTPQVPSATSPPASLGAIWTPGPALLGLRRQRHTGLPQGEAWQGSPLGTCLGPGPADGAPWHSGFPPEGPDTRSAESCVRTRALCRSPPESSLCPQEAGERA